MQPSDREPVVETTQGRLRGADVDGVLVFRGIRYGADTSGANRFRPPRPVKPWQGVRDATVDAPLAPQSLAPATGISASGFRAKNALTLDDMSEDCLALRVTTPALDDGRRPVMVFFHGGNFALGSAMAPVYDGVRLVRRGDVVQVAVNHRLNLFGYLHLAHLVGEPFADAGNLGQLDLIAALGWIRDNIAAFGGDPDNVTVFGQSGGGWKITTLMAMPAARGLFHRAILESGSHLTEKTVTEAEATTAHVLAALGLAPDEAERLLTLPLAALVTASREGPGISYGPVVDGRSLPRQPFAPDAPPGWADLPMIIGCTDMETTMSAGAAGDDAAFALDETALRRRIDGLFPGHAEAVLAAYRGWFPGHDPSDLFFQIGTDSRHLAQMAEQTARKAAQPAPVYCYYLTWKSTAEGGRWRSPHLLELPFVFDTVRAAPKLFADDFAAAQAMADLMSDMWIGFARTGDPNRSGLPDWRPYTPQRKAVMVFDRTSRSIDDPFGERLNFLAALTGQPQPRPVLARVS